MTVPLGRHYVVELHASPDRVAQVRRIVAAHLRYWKLEAHVVPVCKGVVELLTNVHRHADDDNRCVVELRWSGRYLTASVEDSGPRLPRLMSADGGGPLALVAALSDSWGTCATAAGKVIWFTRSVASPQRVPRIPVGPLSGIGTAQTHPAPVSETVPPVVIVAPVAASRPVGGAPVSARREVPARPREPAEAAH
jgi:anti-sigma regulatory factor (Ser/Thr protein kinase)